MCNVKRPLLVRVGIARGNAALVLLLSDRIYGGTRRRALGGADAALASREELARQLQCHRAGFPAGYKAVVGRGVGVVIYAAAPPSDRTIGQQVSRLHCALCCERVWVWAQGLSRGLKIPTNGLRDPQERF